jgi:hypothetical protein
MQRPRPVPPPTHRTLILSGVGLVMVGIAGWVTFAFERIVTGAGWDADAGPPVRARSAERERIDAAASRTRRSRAGARSSEASPLAEVFGDNYELPHPTPEQVAAFLAARGRSAANLVAAYHFTHDLALLREAAAKDPGNARVLLMLADKEETPEAKHAAVIAFRQHHPDNSLGDYLLAAEEFAAGRTAEAIQSLAAAATKGELDPGGRINRELEAIHQFAGATPLVSRALGMNDQTYVNLPVFRLSKQIRECRDQASAAGDFQTATDLTRNGFLLAGRIRSGGSMLDTLAADGVEGKLLKSLPPELVLEPGTPAVADRQAAIQADKEEIEELAEMANKALPQLNARDANTYFDLVESEGELAAARWLRQRESDATERE